jgi:hypothetical protein
VTDESLVEAIEALRREVEQLQRQLAATRAWCLGLEEEQMRLGAILLAAGRTTGGALEPVRIPWVAGYQVKSRSQARA